MNKEVELILKKLKIVSEEKERGLYLCDKEHSKLLLDYTINLQQENEQLKEKIQELKADYGNKAQVERDLLQQENEQLKDNRDKAIELLDKLNIQLKDILKFRINIKEISNIKEILRGDSNE